MTSPYFFQNYGKVEINLQTTSCHYICTLGKANTPLVSPCKRREGAPSHAPLWWQPFKMTAGHLAGERASSWHRDTAHADPGTSP